VSRPTTAIGFSALLLLSATTGGAGEEGPIRPGTAEDSRREWTNGLPVGRAVRVISSEEIWRSNARNLPELLLREGGLWMTFATYAGGTPVVRGLSGNDVLILIDGLEVNNTAYRFGPLEYLSTIDLFSLERIEVIRSAAGAWGGDTHGPVIRLFTKRDAAPLAPGSQPPEKATARAQLRYSTVDKASIAHLQAHHESEHYSFLFGATSRDIGDLRGGDETNFQRVTGYEETAGHTRFQFFLSDSRTLDLDIQVLEQGNIEQYDRIQAGSHLVFDLEPRKRSLFKISYLDSTERSWAQRLEAAVYLNEQRQRAVQQLTDDPEEILQTSDNDDIEGVQIRLRSAVGERHELGWGIEWTDEAVSAVRRRIDTLTGEELIRGTDPTRGGQSRTQLSAWLEDRIQVLPDLLLSAGVRYAAADVDGTQETPVGVVDLGSSESGVSGFLSVAWSIAEPLEFSASFDRGFRLPGIDQVTSFTGNPELESQPNPDLTASTTDALEIGLRYQSERLHLSLFAFRQELNDVTVLVPAEGPSGVDTTTWVRSESIGRREIDGFEVDLDLTLPWSLDFYGYFRTSEGDDLLTGGPLAGQPPDFGLAGLRWRGDWKWEPWAEARLRWADDHSRPAPADLADPSFDPMWLESHDVFELRAGVTFPSRFRLTVTFENPGDDDYRPFGWGIAGAGRNLAAALEYVF
jgi:outer membrane receptor protein involved in Fe transport